MQGNLREILQRLGRDSALPGVDLCIELLQELRADLMGGGTVREVIDAAVIEPKRLGRPPGKGKKGVNGWPSDPAARSREMKRRQALARAKVMAKLKAEAETPYVNHPRDPRHPGHAQWIARLKKAQKKSWNAKSPAEQQAHVAKMLASRAANKKAAA